MADNDDTTVNAGVEVAEPAKVDTSPAAAAASAPADAGAAKTAPKVAVKLTEEQYKAARPVAAARGTVNDATTSLTSLRKAHNNLYKFKDVKEGDKVVLKVRDGLKEGVTQEQVTASKTKIDEAFKNVRTMMVKDGQPTEFAKARDAIKSADPEIRSATKGFKNGLFGEYSLATLHKEGKAGAALSAVKNTTLSGDWIKNNKVAFAGKGLGIGLGTYMTVDAFRDKTSDGKDRSWVGRIAEGGAGLALAGASAMAGRVH